MTQFSLFIFLILLIQGFGQGLWAADRPVERGITHQEAQTRAALITTPVKYGLSFVIGENEREFSGAADINFDLKEQPKKLTLDFFEGKVTGLVINGQVQSAMDYNGHFITLPGTALKKGPNSVNVKFTHAYSTQGAGLHRFKDPEDGRVYMYSDFEPYDANQLFPTFDQPDLKGIFTMKVTAPKDWTVISTTREEKITPQDGGKMSLWTFSPSPIMSTYLISLHAGPYKVWSAQAGAIPLRLFARQALAKYVEPNDWFTFTRQGLKFFGDYFAFPYPFKKYDQVICPDYNHGAMENIAAVTFSERFIHRGKATRSEREDLANVLLHEMAHMWFGDLVTMKWWNDLWLNESFATFMASLALQKATEFKKSWVTFFRTKVWAYTEDQWVTTHPIEGNVPDTETAFTTFDGITYGKGASVLKQIEFFLGPENFKKGVRAYFQKYQYKNAERKDFISSLEAGSGMDLQKWTKQWLQTEGLNTLQAEFTCGKNDKIQSFKIIQSAPDDHPTLRQHRTQVALFMGIGDGPIKAYKVAKVNYEGTETTVKELERLDCPHLVYLNYGDYDYVKAKLDPRTLENIQAYLAKIQDDLTRLQFWGTLWDMVRDGDLDAPTYANMVFENLGSEKEIKVIESVTSTFFGGRRSSGSLLTYLPREEKQAQEFLANHTKRAEDFFWSLTQKAPAGSDHQKAWFGAFIRVAQTPSAQQKLTKILKGELTFPQFPIDQDRRWQILFQLSMHNAPGAIELVSQEVKKDPSNTGLLMSISSDAARPELAKKKEWFTKVINKEKTLPFSQARSAMGALFPPTQNDLRAAFSDDFFSALPKVNKDFNNSFQETFASQLAPRLCTNDSVKRLGSYLASKPELSPAIIKELSIARQEDERCVKVRKLALEKISRVHLPKK